MITRNGNVGIGTTNPTEKLDVNGTTNSTAFTTNGASIAGTPFSGLTLYSNSGISADFTLLTPGVGNNIMTVPAGTRNSIFYGNVGIGTTSPSAKLDVNGNTVITGSLEVTNGITGSLFGTASYALTASHTTAIVGTDNYVPKFNGTSALENSLIYDDGTNIGIGTTSPSYKLQIAGTEAVSAVRSNAGYDIYPVPGPTSLSGVVSAGGSVNTGVHGYYVTYKTAIGETNQVGPISITTTAGNNTVTLTLPISTDERVIARKIYRTKVGSIYNEYLLVTINDNTTTTYVDTAADSTLTAEYRNSYYRANTTTNYITVGGVKAMTVDPKATYFGTNAGVSATSAGYNAFFGSDAGRFNTTGQSNTFIGYQAGFANNTGDNNVIIGAQAAYSTTVNVSSTIIGCLAGRYYNSGNALISTNINSVFLGMRTYAFGANPLNQIVIGQLAESIGDNTVVLGNDSIVTTALKGNVGIGTTTPSAKLQVKGSGATSATTALRVENSDATPSMVVLDNGNIGIGTTTPNAKLTITSSLNQTALGISGYSLTGSNAQPLLDLSGTWNTTGTPTLIRANVTNTASNVNSNLMDLQVGGSSRFKISATSSPIVTIVNGIVSFASTGQIRTDLSSTIGTGGDSLLLTNTSTLTYTSSILNLVRTAANYAPTSGTGTLNLQTINPTINQTGGANGITRGLYVNPTLTSAADFRAIELTNNTGFGILQSGTANNSFAGNVGIGTTTGVAKLTVNGNSIGSNITTEIHTISNGVYGIRSTGAIKGNSFYLANSTGGLLTVSGVYLFYSNSIQEFSMGSNVTTPGYRLTIDGNTKVNGDVLIKAANLSNQENLDVDTGTEVIATVAIATYTAAFFDFVIKNGTNVRSGTVFACHDGTNVEYTETSTADLGNTTPVTLSVDISGTDMRLLATTTTDNWIVKSLVRAL